MNISSIVANCNPFELPSFGLLDREKLPSIPAVYFVLHVNQVLYIGKASSLRSRWKRHQRHLSDLQSIENEAQVAWLSLEGLEHCLSTIEKCFIADYRPPLNTFHYVGAERWLDRPLISSVDRPMSSIIACSMYRPLYCTINSHLLVDYCPINSTAGKPMSNSTHVNRRLLRHLPDHYGISKTTLYNRLKHLSIKPTFENKKAYINEEQLKLLDELDEFLGKDKSKRKLISDFLEMKGLPIGEYDELDSEQDDERYYGQVGAAKLDECASSVLRMNNGTSSTPTPETAIAYSSSNGLSQWVNFYDQISQLPTKLGIYVSSPPNPIEKEEILLKLAGTGICLPTSRLLPLLNLKSIPPLDDHKRFSRRGFVFTRLARAGREYEWRVAKVHH